MRPDSCTPPQKILIIKLSAIGDVVQTLPMMEALRSHYPQARIDWLVEEEASDLLIGHPALTRVVVSRRKSWQKRLFRRGALWSTLAEIGEFIRELRSVDYDWVIDNHGICKSGLMVLLSRGRRKIGFQASPGIADEGNYLFTNERYRPLDIEKHALERYLDLIAQVGVKVGKSVLNFPVPANVLQEAEKLLQKNGVARHPLVIIHPMAKWQTKQWPLANFARVAHALAQKGASVVFTGGPDDEKPVRELWQGMPTPPQVLNLAGQTNLLELAGLFSLSDLVLTPDTGPMHLAAAVQAPLIALFGPTAPWRTGPYGNGHVILRKELDCSPCFKKKCATMECMNALSVEEVLQVAEAKLRI
jgi:3-deoxy-D-manno-octulosonic-acid transferase/heptosyltransferase-1